MIEPTLSATNQRQAAYNNQFDTKKRTTTTYRYIDIDNQYSYKIVIIPNVLRLPARRLQKRPIDIGVTRSSKHCHEQEKVVKEENFGLEH